MKTLEKPNGIWGTILLPINNNQIDWVAFEEQIHILCDSKVSGIYTNGTAAECHNQTEQEFDKFPSLAKIKRAREKERLKSEKLFSFPLHSYVI